VQIRVLPPFWSFPPIGLLFIRLGFYNIFFQSFSNYSPFRSRSGGRLIISLCLLIKEASKEFESSPHRSFGHLLGGSSVKWLQNQSHPMAFRRCYSFETQRRGWIEDLRCCWDCF
ncbi:hypothetical protein VIGAN_04095100, partial [Vigna angularis var. angularis]